MRGVSQAQRQRVGGLRRMESCEGLKDTGYGYVKCKKVGVQWHHAIIYAGKQIGDDYALRGLCPDCHMGNFGKPRKPSALISELLAVTEGLKKGIQEKYPSRDWTRYKQQLETELRFLINNY